MICPPTREGALRQLAEFLPLAPLYARDRNQVRPGHEAVSRLSPAIRHRLVTEDEVAERVLAAHRFSRVEKLVQEIYWRRYWKAWLSLRPQVWESFRAAAGGPFPERAAAVEEGRSGNRLIDHFARELRETGYLHNHARMWVAAWWIHAAGLPWQAGAGWFHRHLLDGDPAANTLSWRWVAGLQTPGKTYLARRANLERYLAAEWLAQLCEDPDDFENPVPRIPPTEIDHRITQTALESRSLDPAEPFALWVHEEDLSPETSPAGFLQPRAVRVIPNHAGWDAWRHAPLKRQWLAAAGQDAATRAAAHWGMEVDVESSARLAAALARLAADAGVSQIAALRPEPGLLGDAMPELTAALSAAGIRLGWVDRPRDLVLRPLATAGFFKFWETLVRRRLIPAHDPVQGELFG